MAFPQIASTATTAPTVNDTSHSVALPSGVASGDLLLLLATNNGNADTSISGWVELYQIHFSFEHASVWYRIADGSEGASVTVGISASETLSAIVLRITGCETSTAPEYNSSSANSTTPNPPSLSPSWGAADNLYLAVIHWRFASSLLGVPTDYTEGESIIASGSAAASIAYAYRESTEESQDPSSFTVSAGRPWVAVTLAIKPAAGSAAKGGIVIAQQLEMLGGGLL